MVVIAEAYNLVRYQCPVGLLHLMLAGPMHNHYYELNSVNFVTWCNTILSSWCNPVSRVSEYGLGSILFQELEYKFNSWRLRGHRRHGWYNEFDAWSPIAVEGQSADWEVDNLARWTKPMVASPPSWLH